MSIFFGASKETPSCRTRYIRVESNLFIPAPPTIEISHRELAIQDKVMERIGRLRFESPESLDAGFINILNTPKVREIVLAAHSSGLDLPVFSVAKEAREITRSLVEKLSLGFTVISLPYN